jgi:hypothetical protein
MKQMAFAVVGLSLSWVVACGGSSDSTFANEKAPENGFGSAAGSQEGFDTNATPPAGDGCSAGARLVYVVTQEKDLYSFAPDTLTFTKIGRLSCPATTGVPVSMAVDRSATAWVNYTDGKLFKVSTTDASCTATDFVPNQQGFLKFGMAFSTNANSTNETLYISGLLGTGGKGLGKVDLATMKATMIGDYSNNLTGEAADLTGTGDGRLYGFFTTSPATLAVIDQLKGATSSDQSLAGVNTGNAFAFSFWGGDFWFYTSDGKTPSKVTRLKSNGEIAVAKDDVGGFRITGAGVSTCAPVTAPR